MTWILEGAAILCLLYYGVIALYSGCLLYTSVRFYEMHIFKYSKREGTRAAVMENQVPEQDKSVRSDILLTLEHKMSDEYRESFLGKETEVLLEEKVVIGGQAYMMGHTRQYVKEMCIRDRNKTEIKHIC